jgi:hypothetical protein
VALAFCQRKLGTSKSVSPHNNDACRPGERGYDPISYQFFQMMSVVRECAALRSVGKEQLVNISSARYDGARFRRSPLRTQEANSPYSAKRQRTSWTNS